MNRNQLYLRCERTGYVVIAASLFALTILFAVGCATNLRDNVRKSALIAGEVSLSIDQNERDFAATNPPGYTVEKRKQVNDAIVVMLTAVRAYERAARAWPESMAIPTTVPQAMVQALTAIAAVENILTGLPGTEKLMANLARVRATIGGDR